MNEDTKIEKMIYYLEYEKEKYEDLGDIEMVNIIDKQLDKAIEIRNDDYDEYNVSTLEGYDE